MPRRASVAVVVAVLVVLAAGCGGGSDTAAPVGVIETVAPAEAEAIIASAPAGLVVLDVRTPDEFASGHLAGAVDLDFYAAGFAADLAALDRRVPYVLYCRTGNRSGQVRQMMQDLGFAEVHEIAGGIVAWAEAGLPIVGP